MPHPYRLIPAAIILAPGEQPRRRRRRARTRMHGEQRSLRLLRAMMRMPAGLPYRRDRLRPLQHLHPSQLHLLRSHPLLLLPHLDTRLLQRSLRHLLHRSLHSHRHLSLNHLILPDLHYRPPHPTYLALAHIMLHPYLLLCHLLRLSRTRTTLQRCLKNGGKLLKPLPRSSRTLLERVRLPRQRRFQPHPWKISKCSFVNQSKCG